MRYSQLFGKTKFEAPADADSVNAKLLLQGGFIDKLVAGVYTFLPLGLRVLKKITTIIREEMDALGGQEISMPAMHPRELWKTTGRDEAMDPILFRTKGAGGHDFIFGPSHEEIVTPLAARYIQSYKDLPLSLYQFQTKFRNEPRAKSGILRGREFGMKDMYSFHATDEDLDAFYEKAAKAYFNVFKRCGLETYMVEASGGAFSDKVSHEFAVKTPAGEDTILICDKCHFAQNIEIAQADLKPVGNPNEPEKDLKKVHAKRGPSIEDGVTLHKVAAGKILKSVVYRVKSGLIGVCIRGDLKISHERLEKYLHESARVVTKEELESAGLTVGFISPIGQKIPFIADNSVKQMKNFITGANEFDYDVINANLGRDFVVKDFAHLSDLPLKCKTCGKELREEKAIEAGNIFKLGTKYTKDFNLKFTDQNGEQKLITMGCYGIGSTRLVGTIVEASHDENGIIWPKTVAPFSVHLATLGSDSVITKKAATLYDKLREQNVEVLFDDRDESAGKKLKDADLIGIPLRVIVSKKSLEKGCVEVKKRSEKKSDLVPEKDVVKYI